NAQGDMGTVNSLIDAAITEGADLLITLSTPTLQAALQRARNLPIVFTYVASGVAAGAGRTDEDHLPNVTGVYLGAAYGELLALIREAFPYYPHDGNAFRSVRIELSATQRYPRGGRTKGRDQHCHRRRKHERRSRGCGAVVVQPADRCP